MIAVIETPRLLLQTADESDVPAVLDFVVRNRDFLLPWEPVRSPDYYTEETQRRLLSHDKMGMEQDQLFKVWIAKRVEPDRVIGSVRLASLRVVEKLGFVNEGLGRKYLKINGVWEDHIHMALINEEMS